MLVSKRHLRRRHLLLTQSGYMLYTFLNACLRKVTRGKTIGNVNSTCPTKEKQALIL